MSNAPARDWKSKAFAAMAKLYQLREERETFAQRVRDALLECERAGCTVDRRWSSDPEPSVDGADAVLCACGAVIALTYEVRDRPRPLSCRTCIGAASTAVAADAAIEKGLPIPTPKTEEEVSF